MTNWTYIARKFFLLATMLLISYCYAHAQIGGPDMPIIESSHRYDVVMDRTVNGSAWYVFRGTEVEVTDLTIENGTVTPYVSLGAGLRDGLKSYINITFNTAVYAIDDIFTIVYMETEPDGGRCYARRYYQITIQPYLKVEINNVPDGACLLEPVSHHTIADPRNTHIVHQAVYEVENTEPEDYAHPWSFTFNFSSTAVRTGYASPNISQVSVNINGVVTTYTPNAPDYENFAVNIPPDVAAIMTVTYQVLPGSAHNCRLMITNMKGSYEDYDPGAPKQETHQIQRLPAPSAITAND